MQYPKVKPRKLKESLSPGVYADLDELIRLQFKVHGFSFYTAEGVKERSEISGE